MIQHAYETKRDVNRHEYQFPSITRIGQEIVDRVVTFAERCGCIGNDLIAVRLGVHEAMVNAIRHGNGGDPDKTVRIACQVQSDELCFEIEDEGPGFKTRTVADPTAPDNLGKPGGRGLMMMNHYMSSVEYNDRGNRVVMRRRIDQPACI